ncbi:MAG: hypothetical protein KJZ91_13965 [Myxococcales bacterium]|nr:hypothetical protein [Myxococcales bacterium]
MGVICAMVAGTRLSPDRLIGGSGSSGIDTVGSFATAAVNVASESLP